jgi:hypothetical protein
LWSLHFRDPDEGKRVQNEDNSSVFGHGTASDNELIIRMELTHIHYVYFSKRAENLKLGTTEKEND